MSAAATIEQLTSGKWRQQLQQVTNLLRCLRHTPYLSNGRKAHIKLAGFLQAKNTRQTPSLGWPISWAHNCHFLSEDEARAPLPAEISTRTLCKAPLRSSVSCTCSPIWASPILLRSCAALRMGTPSAAMMISPWRMPAASAEDPRRISRHRIRRSVP